MNNIIFLPDTNILQGLIEAINVGSSENPKPWHRNILNFFNRCGEQVRVPSIVWGEFCGLWFHKDVNLINYQQWFNQRRSCFDQVIRHLKEKKVKMSNESALSYKNVMDKAAMLTNKKMPLGLISQIIERHENAIQSLESKLMKNREEQRLNDDLQRNKKQLEHGKLLDGLDSIIVSFACEFAKINETRQIVLVTRDKSIFDILKYFSENKDIARLYEVPDNVIAVSPR